VTLTSPKGGEKWARTKTIKWAGSDPDKDNLMYQVFYSGDSGQTWKPLESSAKPTAEKPSETSPTEESAPSEEPPAAPADQAVEVDLTNPDEVVAQMASELEQHPEIPQDVKDKMLAEAPQMIEKAKADAAPEKAKEEPKTEPAEKPASNGTKSTSLTWDTTKYPDGAYLVKVVTSDRKSNPTDAMTGEAISDPLVLSNKTPRVVAFKKTITILADNCARIDGAAYHNLVGLAGVQYKVDSGEWAAAAATDGIFDSTFESFTLTTQALSKGSHTVEVKAVDQAGNAASTKVTVKVE
jgi:hypothetical protein